MKTILNRIKYVEHEWKICENLKVLSMLLGQQGRKTKTLASCACMWDGREKQEHWIEREWSSREVFVLGEKSIKNVPLMIREKVLLPPLHIKLKLCKQFVKVLDKEESVSNIFVESFRGFHMKKLKEIFSIDPKYGFC